MPNWCGNVITLGHDDPAMILRAKEAFANGNFLQEFVPVPADLLNEETTTHYADVDKQRAVDALKSANRDKYGYESWYDWCINEWGTKWDVGNAQGINTWDDHEFIAYFDSAWSPPIAAYDTLTNQGFTVYATWYEPGSAFAGIYDEHGVTDYDLSGMDSGDVEQQIPQELNEQFGISESMAAYEAENEDEVTTWYKEGVESTGLEPHVKPVAH
jgi:hypothetical protein